MPGNTGGASPLQAQTSELDATVIQWLLCEPGTMLAIDRGYHDFPWWLELAPRKVFVVTQLKDNAEYGIVEQREEGDPAS